MVLGGLCALIGMLVGLLVGWLITIGTRRRLKHRERFLQTLLSQMPTGLFYQALGKPHETFASQTLCLLMNLKMPVYWEHILKKFTPEQAQPLQKAYQQLIKTGTAFTFSLTLNNKQTTFLITGNPIQSPQHNGVIVAFQDITELSHKLQLSGLIERHKDILANALDVLNFPLFIRDAKGLTFFANHAVNHEKTNTLNELSWLSLPFQVENQFYTLTYGQDTKTEEELQLILSNMLKAQRRLCEQLPCATCLFNASGQLLACSSAFADLWHLDYKWVQTQPSYEDYWDVIQDNGLLSRVADFADYKRQQREDFAQLSQVRSIFLYLPNGQIIRRTLIPYAQGSVVLLDEPQMTTQK